MPTRMSPLRSAMQKQTRSLVCGERSDSNGLRSMAIVCKSAPHHGKRGRKGGRSSEAMESIEGESMDEGTSNPYSQFACDENAGSVTEFRPAGRRMRRWRGNRFQHGSRYGA